MGQRRWRLSSTAIVRGIRCESSTCIGLSTRESSRPGSSNVNGACRDVSVSRRTAARFGSCSGSRRAAQRCPESEATCWRQDSPCLRPPPTSAGDPNARPRHDRRQWTVMPPDTRLSQSRVERVGDAAVGIDQLVPCAVNWEKAFENRWRLDTSGDAADLRPPAGGPVVIHRRFRCRTCGYPHSAMVLDWGDDDQDEEMRCRRGRWRGHGGGVGGARRCGARGRSA